MRLALPGDCVLSRSRTKLRSVSTIDPKNHWKHVIYRYDMTSPSLLVYLPLSLMNTRS
jgi:hypothetical protein